MVYSSLSFALEYESKGVEKASELIRKMPFSEDSEKPALLKQIKAVRDENPGDIRVSAIYINALISEKQYDDALNELSSVNNLADYSQMMLLKCMLEDRLNKESAACYNTFIANAESKKEKNVDYLMALYLSGNKKYKAEKNHFIRNDKYSSDIDAIETKSKDEILREFFPQ